MKQVSDEADGGSGMDEDFAGFLEDFGPAIETRHVPQ